MLVPKHGVKEPNMRTLPKQKPVELDLCIVGQSPSQGFRTEGATNRATFEMLMASRLPFSCVLLKHPRYRHV